MAHSSQSEQPDPLDKLSIMGWQDLILPVFTSGTLMLLCFYIGHFQFSIIWIILLTGLYLLKTRLWITRQEARIQMRKQILRERGALVSLAVDKRTFTFSTLIDDEIVQFQARLKFRSQNYAFKLKSLENYAIFKIGVVGASNKEIPSWLKFPDSERVEWLNQMLQQLWPYISEYSANFMREFIEPQVLAQMPNPFKSFRFVDIDMASGDMPCRVSGLKVYTQNVGRDKLIVDLDIAYAGDAEFKVKVCGFTGGMNELVCSGRVRCIFQPLIPQPPMVAALNASFVELPKFDFNLTGMGDFLQLPLLNDAIRSVINAQMANMCVLPNSMVIPLVPDLNINRLFVPLPEGVLRVKVVEAGNLENKDVSFIVKDRSDPYCELQLGSQIFRTRTINNNLDPRFDEYFEFVVDQLTAQKLRINVFDEDTTGSDEELGNLSIPMSFVEKSKFIGKWFNLESCKHGTLSLKLFWCQLSASPLPINRPIPYAAEWKTTNRPVHSHILVVFVDNVKGLPFPKSNVEPSPMLEVSLATVKQVTPVKVRTTNPVYQSKFLFLIKQSTEKELQALDIKAVDSNSSKSLGELSIPLSSIIDEPDMEVFDKVYHLRHGVHNAQITLTIRIRHIIPPEENVDLSSYANSSYVERAQSTESHQSNGDVLAPEPGKLPENDPQNHPESQTQLNTSRFTSINRRSSNHSTSSSKQTSKSLKNKLLRFRKPKHNRASLSDLGNLEYAIRYNQHAASLVLDIISAHDLVPHTTEGKLSPYVSIKLVQNTSTGELVKAKRKTNIIEHNLNPVFDSRFEFDLKPDDFPKSHLMVAVKDNAHGLLTKPLILGQAEIPLTNFSRTDSLRHRVALVP